MHIDIQLIPFPPKTDFLLKRVVVVIDVLRATSVIVHAMSQGAIEVIPVAMAEEAFQDVSSGEEIMVASFFNIGATAQRCLELGKDLLLYPSGDEGNFSLEDTVCGGMLIDLIIKKGE